MKLRLHNGSIRLRLSRPEIARLAAGERLDERLAFPAGSAFVYSLELSRETEAPKAYYDDNRLRILLPEEAGRAWASNNEVGIEAPGSQPALLIEKDFQCLHQEQVDPDAFPNPTAAEVEEI